MNERLLGTHPSSRRANHAFWHTYLLAHCQLSGSGATAVPGLGPEGYEGVNIHLVFGVEEGRDAMLAIVRLPRPAVTLSRRSKSCAFNFISRFQLPTPA